MIINDAVERRFWNKVAIGNSNDCWEWLSTDRGNGYGAMKVGDKLESAHRIAWHLHNGEIPDGLLVCHTCDNRSCVNPLHLFVGTNADNMRDAYQKRRITLPDGGKYQFRNGEENPNSKLTADDVLDIRASYEPGKITYRQIAERYDVDYTLIYQIVNRKRWPHV